MPYSRAGARRLLGTFVFSAALWASSVASAGDRSETRSLETLAADLQRLIERELDRVGDHIAGFLEELPRYAAPEVTENGDIVIRRLPRRPEHWRDLPATEEDIVEL